MSDYTITLTDSLDPEGVEVVRKGLEDRVTDTWVYEKIARHGSRAQNTR